MVAYNFQRRFAPKILSGEKGQTIRRKGKRRHARPGNRLQLYTGQRTKSCELLKEAICTETQDFYMLRVGDRIVAKHNGQVLTQAELKTIAKKDGFPDLESFEEFFHDLPFDGVLIKWE